MSRSATPATRNEATTRLQPPKRTTSAELPIGTAIRGSREHLRTVADGCGRGRDVERTHPQPPDPQSETGTLATHSGISHHNARFSHRNGRVSHHNGRFSHHIQPPQWEIQPPQWEIQPPQWEIQPPQWEIQPPQWEIQLPQWEVQLPL